MIAHRLISRMIPVACLTFAVAGGPIMTSASAAEGDNAISRGGRLYDNWFAENKSAKPTADHPAYPIKDGKYGKDESWRCKECHGWDYLGKDGAYGKGARATGIKGIEGARGKDPAEIASLLRDKLHGYSQAQLSDQDVSDLSLFVAKGQIDMRRYVEAGKIKGDRANGAKYYKALCAECHGDDGRKLKASPPLGSVAGNAYSMIHKILNGQPGETMLALRALDHQISADVALYLTGLPK